MTVAIGKTIVAEGKPIIMAEDGTRTTTALEQKKVLYIWVQD